MSLDHLRIENQLPLARLNEFTYFKWLYSYLVLPFNMRSADPVELVLGGDRD